MSDKQDSGGCRKHFTDEQIELLRSNSYVVYVSETTVKFSDEFKSLFYELHTNGTTAKQIFRDIGIDPAILGEKRIEGFCYHINKRVRNGRGFSDLRQGNHRGPSKPEDDSLEAKVRYLEHELAYTRQEVEFLKKTQQADSEAWKQWESKHRQK